MKTKIHFAVVSILIFVLLANSACDLPFVTKPTPTPAPTNTPLPTSTNTPLPTSTNTPTPRPTATATPNYTATLEARNDQAARDIMTSLKIPTDTGKLTWYQDKNIYIDLAGPDWHISQLAGSPTAGDFVMGANVAWTTDSWPVCGIMFRVDNRWTKGNYYAVQFVRISGAPGWDIEYYKDGDLISVPSGKVRFSSFLNLNSGDENQIVISAVGNQFKVYVNGNDEGRYYDYDSKLSEGGLAFLAFQDSGKTSCKFSNAWIWTYK